MNRRTGNEQRLLREMLRRNTNVLVFCALTLHATAACRDAPEPPRAAPDERKPQVSDASPLPFRVPSESEIEDSLTLASVRRGRALIQHTPDILPRHARAALARASCHAGNGTLANAIPLVGT